MPFCEEAAVLQRVADALSVGDVANLPTKWISLVSQAHKRAAGDLMSAVGLKAYSASQISSSDPFQGWHEDLSYVYAMFKGIGPADYKLDAIKELNPLPMLKEGFVLLKNGVPIAPDTTSDVGGQSHGSVDAVADAERAFDRHYR